MINTLKGDRINICFVGKINVGKSSIINKLVGQNISIISEQAGTTTDAVIKRYELHPIGPVTFFDTAGYDDISALGEKRHNATMKVIFKADLAIVVLDNNGLEESDILMINKLKALKVPFFIVLNKIDLNENSKDISQTIKSILENKDFSDNLTNDLITFSTFSIDIDIIKNKIVSFIQSLRKEDSSILKDLIKKNDKIILVMPIDSAAPKGRIILPQMQVLREILDVGAIATCCNVSETENIDGLTEALEAQKYTPRYVITDSQVVKFVSSVVPKEVEMTTFSILFARQRGELKVFLDGLNVLKEIKQDDNILIAEACSHHATGEDIGTVKIPKWLEHYLGFAPKTVKINGGDFPDDLEKYKIVIHCGGCMMTKTEMMRRINECQRQGIAITNYGMIISEMNGVLSRCVKGLL
ncbi:MAG: [FeFe] hydrogenase H-cluster maturation GTPase HydF [Candidatus Cloacimonetes bacterium]|nr:[FeFe] hydrogenase H-cluster maturation GTPase HydF [Candidatus Cloacimonadota bacterium]